MEVSKTKVLIERGRKVRFSARCKAQKVWSSRVSEWRAVQALIKYLQNLWLFLSAFNLTGTTTRLSFDETVTRVQHYYAFHEEASLKVQGIKGSTSQTQGPDGTLSATTLNSVKMILEGLTRLRTKVMELNPNFIQHLDVESLLKLFVENVFSSMRGGNTDTPMPGGGTPHIKVVGMLVVSLRAVNFRFWSHLGCSGQNAIIYLVAKVSFRVAREKI